MNAPSAVPDKKKHFPAIPPPQKQGAIIRPKITAKRANPLVDWKGKNLNKRKNEMKFCSNILR
jgi:hypothetical protein